MAKRREWASKYLTLQGRVLLLLSDGQTWHGSEISAALGRSSDDQPSEWTLRRALTDLRKARLVCHERRGSRFYWQIDTLLSDNRLGVQVLLGRLEEDARNG